jgi:cytochrome P450
VSTRRLFNYNPHSQNKQAITRMKDKLEKFVKEHRDEFDTFEPRQDLWQDISKELPQKKTARVISLTYAQAWRYAAAVALLIAVGFAILQYNRVKPSQPVAQSINTFEKIAPQMAEVESYYTSLINEKRAQMGDYDLKALGIDDNLSQDIAVLDSSYARLKRELLTTPNREKIIDAMIQNLQLRMGILNEQLKTLENIKKIKSNTKNENNIQA